jgi:hypothetical protein
MLLSVMVGSGAQLAAMAGSTLLFALFGFLSPSNRGALSTVMLVCWTLFGFVAGYVSSRLYVTLRGDAWKRNLFVTATAFPAYVRAGCDSACSKECRAQAHIWRPLLAQPLPHRHRLIRRPALRCERYGLIASYT